MLNYEHFQNIILYVTSQQSFVDCIYLPGKHVLHNHGNSSPHFDIKFVLNKDSNTRAYIDEDMY